MPVACASSVLFKCECGREGNLDECEWDETTGLPICPECGKADPNYES